MLALSQVMDPELRKDLVSLNMIKDIAVKGSEVAFTVVLNHPGLPACGPRSRKTPGCGPRH